VQSKTLQNSVKGIHIADLILSSVNGCSFCKLFSEFRVPQDGSTPGTLDEVQSLHELRAYSFLKYNTSISFKDIPAKLRAYDIPSFAVIAQGSQGKELATAAAKSGQLCLQQTSTQPRLLSPQLVLVVSTFRMLLLCSNIVPTTTRSYVVHPKPG
jgi:hypothetical protein